MNWIFASLPLLIFSVLTWVALGLLIVRRVFQFRDGVTVYTLGLSAGLLAYLFFVNALSYVIFSPIAIWIVNIGVWLAVVRGQRQVPPLEWEIQPSTRRWLAVAALVVFLMAFFVNAREVWIDTDGHATMVQLLASGQFPMKFQCNPNDVAAYQYGGDLLSAAVENTANLTPWDAQDVVVAYQVVCLCGLVLLLMWRQTKLIRVGLLGILMLFCVGQITWVLMPLMSPGFNVLMMNLPQTADLAQKLNAMTTSPWAYAVVSPGFLTPTLGHAHRSFSWGFGPLTILLFLALLETPFNRRWLKTLILAYVLGSVTLLQPGGLLLLAVGFAGLTLLTMLRPRRFTLDFNPWVMIALSILIAVVQGGIITDSVKSKLAGEQNVTTSFALNTPTLPGCPLGQADFSCTVLSFANLGLIPFVLPTFAINAFRGRKNNAHIVLALGATAAYILPLFLVYGYTQWNIFRIISFTSWTLAVFITPWLYQHMMAGGLRRWGAVLFIIISTYSGVITLWIVVDGRWLEDANTLDFTPMVPPNDLAMMPEAGRLPLDALIFDPMPCGINTSSRPAYLFGRYTRTSKSRNEWRERPDDYETLLQSPTADGMRAAGYTHVYVDQNWYYSLDQAGQDDLKQGNYEVMAVVGDETDFRILMRVCASDEQCIANPDAFPLESSEHGSDQQSHEEKPPDPTPESPATGG